MLAIGLRQWLARRGEVGQCGAQALAILAETRPNGRAVARNLPRRPNAGWCRSPSPACGSADHPFGRGGRSHADGRIADQLDDMHRRVGVGV